MDHSSGLQFRGGLRLLPGESHHLDRGGLPHLVADEHVTAGYSRQLDDKSSINFAAMYALENSVKGKSPFDPAQDIEIEMDQYELAISYSRNIF